ncbi:MAG: HEAT repeat domain-containing protein [Gemmatimonadetes bacterium]|nr:HEAT repeat domain-containing protein [Gemmatimonadota bacterium]
MQPTRTFPFVRTVRGALALAGLASLGGCALLQRPAPPRYGNPVFVNQVVRILDVEAPSPAFFRERARLEVMGPELDAVLIGLVEDESRDDNVRANSVLLLADRRAPGSMRLLRRQLASSPSEMVRAAAVRGLQRFAPDSAGARNALRAAVGDPSAVVRLNVLQRLDVEEAALIRALLAREDDPRVRTIARQLLELLEARGARLMRDPRGDLRTSGREDAPQIVFHPTWRDVLGGVEIGALWVEMPGSTTLVPLAQNVEVVDGVVPAFFDVARSVVAYEAGGEIRIRDLRTGGTRVVGRGVAPRVIPFTDHIVYVRPQPDGVRPAGDGATVAYDVVRVSLVGGEPEVIGRLEAQVRPDVHAGASPVRWMVVGETRSGFVLRGPGVTTFVLPGPYETPAGEEQGPGNQESGNRE